MKKRLLIVVATVVAAVLGWRVLEPPSNTDAVQSGSALVQVEIPSLSTRAIDGKTIFDTSCAKCHGENAAGVDGAGPPLVHIIYEPNHHADIAFYMAVQQGVRAHHWRFGDMQPVHGVTKTDVTKIIAYVRELQRANGID